MENLAHLFSMDMVMVTLRMAIPLILACGSHAAAKEKGLIRLEGKEYVVKDGDVILFRFNV